MNEDEQPTTVSFTVAKEQVWIDANRVAWYVTSVGATTVMLERTIVETVPLRDLVRSHRLMNDKHPLFAPASPSKDATP